VTILAVTYRERPWITEASFTSVYRELSSLRGLSRPPRLVVATGCDEDDRAIQRVHNDCCESLRGAAGTQWPPELVLLRDASGKRPAIANALREVVAGRPDPEGVVVFLDGDTLLQPGLLEKVLPLFRLKPDVDAVTTDEDAWVKGPRWFAEWISLRLGLRHRTMCSVALSGRLLCLTGRLSAFRASVTLDPSFLGQVEHDSIQHWLWGSFDMLSGDDKSTWYWLAARGRRMLYVPDALATTIEVVSGPPLQRAMANIRRWSGNSIRHSWRAFQLGPKKLGWFSWYSLLDQRLAIWTVLIGPLFALLALCGGRFEIAAGYGLWVMCSRLTHSAISWRHGRRVSAYYLPLQILSDWIIAITKIWVLFHPAKQSWLNRGARTLDAKRSGVLNRLRIGVAHYLCGFTCAATILLIGIYTRFVPVLNEAPLYLRPQAGNEPGPRPAAGETSPRSVVLFGTEAPADGATNPGTTTSPSAARSVSQDSVALATLPLPQP
jgi:glycosyltransferase Alg8